ncbi:hypothetical protein [Paenibacillus xylanexedens]|uniref:hypothetical protein n=1 Tax=Paenibacillus xylanexedens TaxID=528191 RepID=UPI000F5371D7|nr:hypothetical protein [Paenibacillus xylanexedens]RPK23998.1 hypothetical protein EDO6_04936 [Paenibacillus xylanexedens]
MEEPEEYYEAHERIKQAMYSYELENLDVEFLGGTEYQLEEGKVLIKYMRDRYYFVVIRCYDWIIDYNEQIVISKFSISDYEVFMRLINEQKVKL